jgi:signal transduction histidine kinase
VSAKPLIREPSKSGNPDGSAGERLPGLSQEIGRKLTELESALKGGKAAGAAGHIAQLREILARQTSLQESFAAQVEREVEERTRELASFSNFLQLHAEREKAALARELHDALGGILTPAKMDLAWLESRLGNDPDFRDRMKRLSGMIDQGIDLKRRIIENLRPSLLDHLGLASALQWFVEEQCRSSGMECRLHISDKLERLAPDLEITLYRVVQEGVINVVAHAHAKRLDVRMDRTTAGLELEIADNGQGVADVEGAMRAAHGLAGLVQRVRSIAGRFDLRSVPGEGTRLRVFVPL